MSDVIDLIPQQVDLRLYVGDDPELQLRVWATKADKVANNLATGLVDLSPFTDWVAQVRGPAGQVASFAVDTSQGSEGLIRLLLEGEDVRGFPKSGCRWDIQVTQPPDRQVTIAQGRVRFVDDVSR